MSLETEEEEEERGGNMNQLRVSDLWLDTFLEDGINILIKALNYPYHIMWSSAL
mgnify:CR=1 FL=1